MCFNISFNITWSQQAIISLDAGVLPLFSADWGPNPLKVASLAAGELFLWDVSRPSRPLETRTIYIEGGLLIKFSPGYEHIVASIGKPDNILKVSNFKLKQVVLHGKVKIIGGLSWHHRYPYVCAGSDRELHFWKIKVN